MGRVSATVLILMCGLVGDALAGACVSATGDTLDQRSLLSAATRQPAPMVISPGDRILLLRGWGAVHHSADDKPTTAVGINIVTGAKRIEGDRVWVASTGGDDSGWIETKDVLPLADAIPYFDTILQRNPQDWNVYLLRAEAEHALNQREAATSDYTKAIELHPRESFLHLRRGRHFNTLRPVNCAGELNDFNEAIRLVPVSVKQGYNLTAELYSLEAGVYCACPDPMYRNPQRAIILARRAVNLDPSRPTLLTILAVAYASAGDFRTAVTAQQRALDSPRFPPGYRDDAENQLLQYKQSALKGGSKLHD
jgi:hypothetical protein